MTFYLRTYLCFSYSSLQDEAGTAVEKIKLSLGTRYKKKKQLTNQNFYDGRLIQVYLAGKAAREAFVTSLPVSFP